MPSTRIPHITCEHFLQEKSEKEGEHVILDVRDVGEFDAGHIKASVNVPKKELLTNVMNVIPDKKKKIIAVVGPTQEPDIEEIHGTLTGLGYAKVEFLAGGFDKFCEIAPLEIEPDLTDLTPEEAGARGSDGSDDAGDPHMEEDEPIL